ncbi:MAG: FAD-dependent monooxygenase [Actinophytocola sp.]|uniref:oxidoreductase n=1 Tax=Actinophytocola sp. TaxID=1872138 RepID=UPI003D6A74F0
MRVEVVGAGPAGLYLAILLKRADAAHEVTVVERNAPDATFGWGVVFSEETLGALRDADYATYLEITDSFARWTSIDIHYRGQVLRSTGHTFSAIKRTHLLDILQRRARALGVTLKFGVEVSSPSPADLVVAADGANSVLRRAGDFGTTSRPQGCKYVWFGTDLVFDAFTFIFKQTEHGLFQVHAYPFDEHTSTFIVETTEETWRRAGLDAMSEEESIAFCRKLFADELGEHRLMSNKSAWLDFPLVRNASWHDRNVVLVGDSAHTAHFSIGSGTKLAMEDAIALANSFVRHPSSVEQALTDYELERQPIVERFQQAAGDSAAYFSRVSHYTGLEPIQFAFNLLTRSGRISHANLTQRDPHLIRVLDSWFAATAGGSSAAPGSVAAPPTFAPLRIGGLTTRNRVVRAGGDLADAARTGAGLVLTGFVAVSAAGRTTPSCPVLDESWAPVVGKLVDTVHDAGALVGVRLGHAGRRGAVRESGVDVPLRDGWPLLSASPLRYAPFGPVPREMSAADMEQVRSEFVAAATQARSAGFDALELDLADGYLLASFLSPLTNRRTDAFGTDRLRFPLSVVDAVRAAWPADRLLVARLTVTDWARGGLTVEDGIAHAGALAAHGVDLVHVRAGHTTASSRPEYRRGYLTTLSDRVRNEAGVPTLVGGYLTTPDEMNTIVAAGRADLCLFDPPRSPLEAAL